MYLRRINRITCLIRDTTTSTLFLVYHTFANSNIEIKTKNIRRTVAYWLQCYVCSLQIFKSKQIKLSLSILFSLELTSFCENFESESNSVVVVAMQTNVLFTLMRNVTLCLRQKGNTFEQMSQMSGGALVNLSMKLHVEKDICFRCSQSLSVKKEN